jgi:hypothetical protein
MMKRRTPERDSLAESAQLWSRRFSLLCADGTKLQLKYLPLSLASWPVSLCGAQREKWRRPAMSQFTAREISSRQPSQPEIKADI